MCWENLQPPRSQVFSTYIPLVIPPVLPLVVGVPHPAIAVHVDIAWRKKKTLIPKSQRGGCCWLAREGPQKVAMIHVSPAYRLKQDIPEVV